MFFFLKRCSLFLFITSVIAFSIQYLTDLGLKKSNFSQEYKEWYEIKNSKINADLIILGSSRALRHFSPIVIDKNLNLNSYNLGMDGQFFLSQKWRLKQYLKYNKKPATIIQTVDYWFLNNPKITTGYTQFIPYINSDFVAEFDTNTIFTKKDYYLPLYKYSHTPGILFSGISNMFNSKPSDNGKFKGFKPNDLHWNNFGYLKYKKNVLPYNAEVNQKAYYELNKMIGECKSNGINLIFVFPPNFVDCDKFVSNHDSISSLISALCKVNKIVYLDYHKIPMCSDTSYFYDLNHLNLKGVEKFNNILVSDLKNNIYK